MKVLIFLLIAICCSFSLASQEKQLQELRAQYLDIAREISENTADGNQYDTSVQRILEELKRIEIQKGTRLVNNTINLDWFLPSGQVSDKKMSVCIVASSFEGLYINSGIGTFYAVLADFLANELGYSVTVVYTRDEIDSDKSFQHWVEFYAEKGIQLKALPPLPRIRVHASYHLRKSYEVYSYLKEMSFDLIHFPEWEGVGYYSMVAKSQGLAFKNTMMVVGLHGSYRWVSSGNALKEADHLEIDFMERKSIEMADAAIAPSSYIVNWMVDQAWTLPQQVYMMPFLPGPSVKQVIEEESALFESKEGLAPEIVFFGRLEGRKGVKLFCDALDLLAKEYSTKEPAFKITFLGRSSTIDGESAQDYISSRAENGAWPFEVKIISTLGRTKALRYLASGNRLAVIPSLFDNAPYTVYECMYAKLPFIASNTASIAPLVSNANALFDLDATSLFHKMAASLQTLASTGSFEVVSGVFDVASTETLWKHLYQEISANAEAQKYSVVAAASRSPLVSVVITSYNRPALLRLAVESVDKQDYSNIEIIVVDDGSTDSSALALIEEMSTSPSMFTRFPLLVIKSTNEYLGAARNKGVRSASGEFIMFLDDDNYAKPNQIFTYVKAIQQTGVDSLTAIHDVFEGQGVPTEDALMYRWLPVGPALSVALFRNPFGDANTLFVSKAAFETLGGFTEDRDVGAEDYEFHVKLTLSGMRQQVIPESLVFYRKHNVDQMVDSTDQLNNQLRALRPFTATAAADDVLVVAAYQNLETRSVTPCNETFSLITPQRISVLGGTVTISGIAFDSTKCGTGLTSVTIGTKTFTGAAITITDDKTATVAYPSSDNGVKGLDVTIVVNGQSLQMLAAFEVVEPPPAVNMISAQLDDTATSVVVTFDVDTNSYGGGDCAKLLGASTLDFLGPSPSCVFSDPKSLFIQLGTPNTITPGSSVIAMASGNKLYTLIDGDFGIHEALGTATVAAPANPIIAVSVTVVAASNYNDCDGTLTVDGTGTAGNAGRAFSTFTWSSTSTSAAINTYITNANTAKLDTLLLDTNALAADATTTITLTIANWLGATASSSVTVTKNAVPLPTVIPQGQKAVSVLVSSDAFALRVLHSVPDCYSTKSMSYEWTGTTGTPVATNTNSYSELYLKPSTDLVVGTNTLTFSCWFDDAPTAKVTASYTVEVANSPLQVAIVGAPKISGRQDPLTLDAQTSKDPDNTAVPFEFVWSCISSTGYVCTEHLSATTGGSVTLDPNDQSQQPAVGDVWTIAVNATKGSGRAGSKQVNIRFVSGSPPTLQIAGVPDSGLVLPAYPFYLYNKLDKAGYTYQWTVEESKFNLITPLSANFQGETTSAFTIVGGAMSPGIQYTITCTVTSQDGSATDSATFTTARPPWAGSMAYSVVTTGAYYLEHVYKFSLNDWNTQASTAPLKYSWALQDPTTGALTPLSGDATTTKYATFGIPAYGAVTIVGIVEDAIKGRTTVTADLTIEQGTIPSDAGTKAADDVKNGKTSAADGMNAAKSLNAAGSKKRGLAGLSDIVDTFLSVLNSIPITNSLASSIAGFVSGISGEATVPVSKLMELYDLAENGINYLDFSRDAALRAKYIQVTADLATRIAEYNEGTGSKRTIGGSSATINQYQLQIQSVITNLFGQITSGQPAVTSTITDPAGNVLFEISVVKKPKNNIGTIYLSDNLSVTFPSTVLNGVAGSFTDGVGVATIRAVSFYLPKDVYQMIGNLMTVQLYDGTTELSISGLTDPIKFTVPLSSYSSGSEYACKFFDYGKLEWDADGCTVDSKNLNASPRTYTCACNHLTEFSVSGLPPTFTPITGCTNSSGCGDYIGCSADRCIGGTCVSIGMDHRCDDNDPCTIDTCDLSMEFGGRSLSPTLGCVHTAVDCSDDIPCTIDACTSTGCTHTKSDSYCNDGNPCTVDKCDITMGRCTNLKNDSACDDNNVCTIDSCGKSGCVYTSITCDDDIYCTAETCDAKLGCQSVANDTRCNDGIACTTDKCDVNLGRCKNVPSDKACDDSNACTVDICDPIQGCVHLQAECDDAVQCTIDSCNIATGACVFTPNNTLCDDGKTCTADICLRIIGCSNLPSNSLCDDEDSCTVDICDETTGDCFNDPMDCEDDMECTVDTCSGGSCVNTANDTKCDDGISCTKDTCDINLGRCNNQADHMLCDDSDPCTIDQCDIGKKMCVNTPIDCRDDMQCTDDTCVAGLCLHQTNDTACDDKHDCTVDSCSLALGRCVNTPTDSLCDDSVECTTDHCGLDGICHHIPDDWICDDYIPCTHDICNGSGCFHIPMNSHCDDGISCTTDVCDTFIGCVITPTDSLCNDGIACTGDICDVFIGCINPTDDSSCDDGVDCTFDTCEQDGCHHYAEHNLCDDNLGCTIDVCTPSLEQKDSCVHNPQNDLCSDGLSCSSFYCNITAGCVVDHANCPVVEKRLCINCKSAYTRIESLHLSGGLGVMRLKTRFERSLPNTVASPMQLSTGFEIHGHVVTVGEVTEAISSTDNLVLDSNKFRQVPQTGEAECNEISRGTVRIAEEDGQDITLICLKTVKGYEWVELHARGGAIF